MVSCCLVTFPIHFGLIDLVSNIALRPIDFGHVKSRTKKKCIYACAYILLLMIYLFIPRLMIHCVLRPRCIKAHVPRQNDQFNALFYKWLSEPFHILYSIRL